jgi:hypothetical protein
VKYAKTEPRLVLCFARTILIDSLELVRRLAINLAWPHVEAGPWPVGSGDLVSLQVGEEVATGDASVFITRESSVRCADNLSYLAFELRPLGYYPGMGRTTFLYELWLGTARCNGCLHAAR